MQNGLLVLSVLVLLFSFYIDFVHQLQPCPLCLMQRFIVVFLLLSCIAGIAFNSFSQAKRLLAFQYFLSIAGLYFAGRQLWLQSLPLNSEPEICIPGMHAMLHYFSWLTVFKSFLWGTTDCSRVDWRWFGISIPLWSMIYYALVLVITGLSFSKLYKTKRFS